MSLAGAIAGFAWAGESRIARVDVSTDGGASWGRPGSPGPGPGSPGGASNAVLRQPRRTLLSRATDDAGARSRWCRSGTRPATCGTGEIRVDIDVRASAGVPAAGPAEVRPSPSHDANTIAAGRAVDERAGLACHDSALIEAQRLSDAAWRRSVAKMVQWGARGRGVRARRAGRLPGVTVGRSVRSQVSLRARTLPGYCHGIMHSPSRPVRCCRSATSPVTFARCRAMD